MKNFSENEIKEILGEETAEKKEKNHKVLAAIGIGAVLVAVILAIVIPLSTIKNDEAPDMGGNKHEITPATDFEYSIADGYATINKYIGSGMVVVLPDEIEGAPVRYIGDNAFSGTSVVKQLIMPDGIVSLGDSALSGQFQLGMIRIPVTLESIGSECFKGCAAITEFSLPESVSVIGEGAFIGCTKLEEVDIPENVTEINDNLFRGCSSLKVINLPEKITAIGDYAFSGTRIPEIILPDSIVSIGNYAFERTDITAADLPEALETLGEGVFNECNKLTEISVPDSITEIKANSFYNCWKLADIKIGKDITKIGDNAFTNCFYLSSITLPDSLEEIGVSSFKGAGLSTLTLPDSVERIGEECFYNCKKLKGITLSDSLKAIEPSTFGYCTELTGITIPPSVRTIGSNAFEECYSISEITFSEGLEAIDSAAFLTCKRIRKLEFPETLKSISADRTFAECSSLTEIILPEGLERFDYSKVGESADVFFKCEVLDKIYFPSTFKDEKIAVLLFERGIQAAVFAENNDTFALVDDSILSKDKTHLYMFRTYIREGDRIGAGYYFKLPDSVTSMSEHAFDILSRGYMQVYITVSENFSEPETETNCKFIKNSFVTTIINAIDTPLNDELISNARKAILDLKETDPRFSTRYRVDPYTIIRPTDDMNGVCFNFSVGASTYVPAQHVVYIYPSEYRELYSSENGPYITAPNTYYSDEIGEYGISFTTDIEWTEFTDTNEFVDYFVVESDFSEYKDINEELINILIRHNLFPNNFTPGLTTSVEIDPDDKEIVKAESWLDQLILSVEIYPSGHYGDNGEEVLTTANGQFSYSIRAINEETGEIYY